MSIPAPAYMRIRNYIVGLVQRSNGTPEKIASEKELGEKFDVSRGTVRKALSDLVKEGYIFPKRGMGTYINPVKALAVTKEQPAKIIGVIISNGMLVHYSHFNLIVLGTALTELGNLDCTVRLINLAHQGKDAVTEIESLGLDGLLWLDPGPRADKTIEMLSEHHYPLLVLDCRGNCDSDNYVRLSNIAGLTAGTEYLINRGHRGIVYAGTWSKIPDLASDYKKICSVLKKAGIPVRKELCLKFGNRVSSFTNLLKERKCTAVLSQGGDWIKSILKVMEDSADRLPDNFELVTFDSSLLSNYESLFKIKRIQIPFCEGAILAARLTSDLVYGKLKAPVRRILDAQLRQ